MNENAGDWTVDLEQLLAPITTERPAGESLRYEGTYDQIQEARREDNASLPQGIWQTPLKQADWDLVAKLCYDALETKSKDLQLAAWLLEAWIHQYGCRGAHQGILLMAGLCEAFWDDLYPELDKEGMESRLGPVMWVNEKLSIALKMVPLTASGGTDSEEYRWIDWEVAALGRQSSEGEETPTLAEIRRGTMLTSKAFYVSLYAEFSDSLDAIVELERQLDALGGSGPYLHEFRFVTQEVQQWVSSVIAERESEEMLEDPETDRQETDAQLPEAAEKRNFGHGLIRGRSDAYKQLSEIADYLAAIEPHSPTPHLIRRAVSWGGMTMTELFDDLVQNESDLRAIYALLGINR